MRVVFTRESLGIAVLEKGCQFCTLIFNAFSVMGWEIQEHLALDTSIKIPVVVWTSS
jgi:hypothetical protein